MTTVIKYPRSFHCIERRGDNLVFVTDPPIQGGTGGVLCALSARIWMPKASWIANRVRGRYVYVRARRGMVVRDGTRRVLVVLVVQRSFSYIFPIFFSFLYCSPGVCVFDRVQQE
jgi:hypothetical protein